MLLIFFNRVIHHYILQQWVVVTTLSLN